MTGYIFVTVGGGPLYSMDRLLKEMDHIAPEIGHVIMQTGCSSYRPRTDHFKFCPMEDLRQYIKNASLVVGHAGAGTFLWCKQYNKPFIAVPRLKKYGEKFEDDSEFTDKIKEDPTIALNTRVCEDVKDLKKLIKHKELWA